MIRLYRPGGPMPGPNTVAELLWEVALECVRRAVAPDAISRLDCLFACASEREARTWRDGFRPGGQIYLIEPIDAGTCIERRDYGVLIAEPGTAYAAYMPEPARRYWLEEPTGEKIELLIGGPVRVTAKLP